MFLIACVFMVIGAVILCRAYHTGLKSLIWTLLAGFFFMCLAGPALMWLPFLAAMTVTVVCGVVGVPTRQFAKILAGALVAGVGVDAALYVPVYREHRELRQKFPTVALDDRLGYETRHDTQRNSMPTPTGADSGQAMTGPALLSVPDMENALEKSKEYSHHSFRKYAVRSLPEVHDNFVSDFVAQPGFGVGRMSGMGMVRKQYIDLPAQEAIPLPQPTPDPTAPSAGDLSDRAADVAQGSASDVPRAQSSALRDLHVEGVVDFVNSNGFGYVTPERRILGFQSHAFTRLPDLKISEPTPKWTMQNLELVSLLKFETPVAYASKHLPKMDELRGAPTRPLDPFEVAAIAKLRLGEDIVLDVEGSSLRMVGALRSLRHCQACHQVERGGLLGAFTYRFRRDPPVVEPPPATKPVSRSIPRGTTVVTQLGRGNPSLQLR